MPASQTLAAREANAEELHELIAAELLRHPGAELVERLHSHDVPCALVNPIDRVHLDPQVRHNGIVIEHDRPWLGLVREPRPPAHFSTTPTALGRHCAETRRAHRRGVGRDRSRLGRDRGSPGERHHRSRR